MSAVLKSPWQGLSRQRAQAAGSEERRVAARTGTSRAPRAQVCWLARTSYGTDSSQSRYALPEFFESMPVSTLRQVPSTHVLKSTPTVSSLISAGKTHLDTF
jgi:ATP-dependent metalloprotease